jgi:hypothetical protein
MRSVTVLVILLLIVLHSAATFGQRVAWACGVVRSSPAYYDKEDPYAALQSAQYAAT